MVTGGGRGIGRAIVERLLTRGHAVVVVERDAESLSWARGRVTVVAGDAAVFRDAALDSGGADLVLDLVDANLRPVVVGSGTAVRRFLAAGAGGSIVNISSHQARRPVPGALSYSTAKAAIEGLTRALAVEYGRHGIRANAVAPGSVTTVGRVATSEEVAAAVEFLLSGDAGFINGATVPVDGGRSVPALDPEAR
ncbi:NAD(P)-dependent dehydrogenase (short-subunit alcohol dehydrogenase family) [Nocardia sp. GAS34]|uniref:SDR family NAD(P)-dependent oxidoreductase n=1 Tax=unclassified Nocardia TaxID=2637762 RepID=UPI003D1A3A4D